MTITDRLFELQDLEYADFQHKLTPTVDRELFIGVRVPEVRKLAKELIRSAKADENVREELNQFIRNLPHEYYDENMLHGLLVSEIKEYNKCIEETDAFLPYVDNWAVCDIMSPKVFAKNRDQLIEEIRRWVASEKVYTCRFGIEMLMSFYLDDHFREEYLEIPAVVISDEYYVKMMVAWFFATALAKQWDATITYIEQKRLGPWTHNKTIQKARESRRITEEQKEYLKNMKISGGNADAAQNKNERPVVG